MIVNNITDSLTIIEEILSESPHLSGIQAFDSIEAPKENITKVYPCHVFHTPSSDIRNVQFDEHLEKGSVLVLIDVLVRIGKGAIQLYIDKDTPLSRKGSLELSVELQRMFALFEFDLSKMVTCEDIIYIARPVDDENFITWASDIFLSVEEARRFSMLIIDFILKAEEES